MGRLYLKYFSEKNIYVCYTCKVHLADKNDIISKQFQGVNGPAYLFRDVVNVCTGGVEKRLLRTGHHEVADIYCKSCQETLGWKYEIAYEEDQKYKEGKFILEKAKAKLSTWLSFTD